MNTSPLWHRAALLGSAWASLEIIVGSFLHNIRFPLAGTLLAALGVLLMVAGRRIWDQPGLLWRAGVVCALMKSLSPSAVILGPMAGIMLEAFLLEITMRILGTTLPGVLIGGALATSVSLLQKAAGLIITYGTDVARLYAALVETAAGVLSLEALGPVEFFVILLLALSAVLGMIAGLLGIRLAQTARTVPAATVATLSPAPSFDLDNVDPAQRFSTKLLALHIVLLPVGLFLLSALPLPLALGPIAVYVTACLLRYRRLVHRLGRVRLWVEFALVALLAGFFLGNLDRPGWTVAGLGAGAEMIARAAFIIVSFASISVELRNPAVLRWFIRHGLGELSSALAVAFRALPGIIRVLDEDRAFLWHPWTSLARVLSTAVSWVEAQDPEPVPVVFLITGDRASGKTAALTALAGDLLKRSVRLRGFAALAVFEGQERLGYDLKDLVCGSDHRPLP